MILTLSIVITSVAIMQVSRFYCNCVAGTFCNTYVMLVDLFVVVMKVTVFVAIMLLEVPATLMQVKVSAANMWVTVFIEIMHVGVSVAIMQVVFSAVHYVHDYFYCYAGDCFSCSYVVTVSSSNFIFLLSLADTHFS